MSKITSTILAFVLATSLCLAQSAPKRRVILPEGSRGGRLFPPGLMVGDTLYVSAFIGFDSKTGRIPDKFEDEMHNCLDHVRSVLKAGGMDFEDAVSVQIYLTDMSLYDRMNSIYLEVFKDPKPTRTTVQVVKVADGGRGAHIEMTVTARK